MKNKVSCTIKKINIFEKNPKKILSAFVLIFIIILDIILGLFLIPKHNEFYRIPNPYYHHGFLPNIKSYAFWRKYYQFYTNSLGFKDNERNKIPLTTTKKRYIIIGDSFIEGNGVSFENSVCGILKEKAILKNIEILNAGVTSYSPKLYYLKIKYLLEKVKLKFDSLIVFFDISDIQDEILYKNFEPNDIPIFNWTIYKVKKFLKAHSFIFYSINKIFFKQKNKVIYYDDSIFPSLKNSYKLLDDESFAQNRANWTASQEVLQKWGNEGINLALKNMLNLKKICDEYKINLAVAVYPWPAQIINNDIDSIDASIWKEFCENNNAAFINLFTYFINEKEPNVLEKYFIKDDVHWNIAGNKFVADIVSDYIK